VCLQVFKELLMFFFIVCHTGLIANFGWSPVPLHQPREFVLQKATSDINHPTFQHVLSQAYTSHAPLIRRLCASHKRAIAAVALHGWDFFELFLPLVWPVAASSCAQPSFSYIWDHLNNMSTLLACMWSLMLFALDT